MDKFDEIKDQIQLYLKENKKLFVTSSFQTHSIPLLHIISRIDKNIPIYFLNTGFLFPETMVFKDELSELLEMKIIGLESQVPKSQQLDRNGHLLFMSDPDYCCYLNKILPLEPILLSHDVWINGIRADQNDNRAKMRKEEKTPQGALRYHPMLKWTSKDIYEYRKTYNLPAHPLEDKGYLSIGCEPCTRKIIGAEDERAARWFGLNKTECGLHTELITKEE